MIISLYKCVLYNLLISGIYNSHTSSITNRITNSIVGELCLIRASV